jgi:dTDP-4-amino-4,6-dideoxygalactose transaminase
MSSAAAGPFRHQLASSSPIRWRGLARALGAAGRVSDPRSTLAELLRREYGAAGAFLCGSGTEALVVAMEAAVGIGASPVVALPAFSCFDVAAAAARVGRPVRFYDVDPASLGPSPESLAAAVRQGAGVVVVASLFGVPVDWEALGPVLPAEVVVVEDAAQGHGGRWRSAPLGAHGRLGVLSFARGKGWTGGAGGAVLVRDEGDLGGVSAPPLEHDLAAELKVVARAGAQRTLGRPGIYRLPRSIPLLGLGETRYRSARAPSGMPASAAALLLDSHEAAAQEAAIRRVAASTYRLRLERAGIRCVSVPAGGEAGYVRFPLVLAGGIERFRDPARALTLGAAPSYPAALPTLAAMAPLTADGETGVWPGATRLAAELVTLPTHRLVTEDERGELLELLGAP